MIFEFDKKVLLYWRFTAAVLFAAVFSALWLVPFGFFILKAIFSTVLTAVFILYSFGYLPRRCKLESFGVENGRIVCKKGVVLQREYLYPTARLVYIQTVRLPLASCFGLTALVLKGVGHSLILGPVTYEQALLFKKAVDDSE